MKVFVVDDFLKDPHKERSRALAADFRTVRHNGVEYRGIAETSDAEVEARLDELIGFGPAKERVCFWRSYLADEESETYIHSDVQIGHLTAILYLSLPEHAKGGLAFWRHKLYGWSAHPDAPTLERQGLRDTPELWDSVWKDGFDEFKWEMEDYVPIYFNRLVLFASPRFHSRYPKRAFGTSVADGRLIKTWFLKYDAR
jgi:hypothetical protein